MSKSVRVLSVILWALIGLPASLIIGVGTYFVVFKRLAAGADSPPSSVLTDSASKGKHRVN